MLLKNNYLEDSIKTLNPVEHVRKHTGMYLGGKGNEGLLQSVKEIISNSVDEFLNSSDCNKIIISFLPNKGIKIQDNGRGIPHGKHSSGCSNLQACFGLINTGGKFDNNNKSGYNTSGGQHGVGAFAVNAISKKFIVKSYRDGIEETVEFSKGHFISSSSDKIEKGKSGTCVEFYPDEEVLGDFYFEIETIKTMVQELSFLCRGLSFVVVEENGEKTEFLSKNGLIDYLFFLNKESDFLTEPFFFEKKEDKYQVEVAIGYNKGYSPIIRLYTNSVPQSKGTHLTGFKTAWTAGLNSLASENNWIKEKESNLTGSDFEEGMILIINFKMIDPVFKGQIKGELTSPEGRTYVQKFTSEALKEATLEQQKNFKTIIDKALQARRAREAARKAKEAIREGKDKKGLRGKVSLSKKFIDCSNKKPSERNLLLVEGLSAGSSAIEARKTASDAIYMLKGKTVSPLKTTKDKLLQNQEMSEIVKIIGAGFDDNFDVNKMNFNKIVIVSDADSDGFSIELLLITFFYTYMRPLIEAGKLYRAITPLYIVRKGKEELYFYTEEEMNEWRAKQLTGWDVIRAKG